MAKYTVEKITKGINKDKWGVYRGSRLVMVFSTKGAATMDANRRNDEK